MSPPLYSGGLFCFKVQLMVGVITAPLCGGGDNTALRLNSSRRIDSPGLRFAGPPSLRLRRKEGKEKRKKTPLCAKRREGDKRSDAGVSR